MSAPLSYIRVPQFTLIRCVDVQDTIIKNINVAVECVRASTIIDGPDPPEFLLDLYANVKIILKLVVRDNRLVPLSLSLSLSWNTAS